MWWCLQATPMNQWLNIYSLCDEQHHRWDWNVMAKLIYVYLCLFNRPHNCHHFVKLIPCSFHIHFLNYWSLTHVAIIQQCKLVAVTWVGNFFISIDKHRSSRKKTKMFTHIPIYFTTIILSLSIILMIFKVSDGSPVSSTPISCNESSYAECQVVNEEQEFMLMMDTEGERRILGAKSYITYPVLEPGKPYGNGAGRYAKNNFRTCKIYEMCRIH